MLEVQLARALGVDRALVRQMRGVEDVDWWHSQQGVMWGASAVAGCVESVRAKKAADGPATVEAVALPAAFEPVVLTIARTGFSNTMVMLAKKGADPELLTVYVKDARLFLPGMEVLARLREGVVYDFAGNPNFPQKGARLPRARGIW